MLTLTRLNALLPLLCFLFACTLFADTRPNVLFISVDDLNDFPSFMGSYPDAKTPHMDRLAAQGVAFTNAHCQYPLCGPSRASFMSGLMPSTLAFPSHMKDHELEARAKELGTELLHSYFAKHGYKTMAVGKICHKHVPVGSVDLSGGRGNFNATTGKLARHWSRDGTSTDWAAAPERDDQLPDYDAAQWAVERLGETHDKPFMLMVGFLRPHVAWYVPQKWFDLYPNPDQLTIPPNKPDDFNDISAFADDLNLNKNTPTTEWVDAHQQREAVIQAYLACVSFADHYVGQVLDALEASPYADNTIVVLISDHGYHLGEKNRYQKHTLWERSSHVPFTISGPGIKPQQKSQRTVGLIDLYPTLLELAGLPANSKNEGRSLKPLIENPQKKWPYPTFTEWYGNVDRSEPTQNISVQRDQYRYTRYADGSEELYDHKADIHEWNNLANDPKSRKLKKRLIAELPTKP